LDSRATLAVQHFRESFWISGSVGGTPRQRGLLSDFAYNRGACGKDDEL
jgi:hypothetical protein